MNTVLDENGNSEVIVYDSKEKMLDVAEDVLNQMQSKLVAFKEAKQSRARLASEIKELSLKLAEAQAEEVRLVESLLELEIEWQELTNNLNNLDVSSD